MDIKIEGESLDLREGFSIDMEEISPIYSDEGSQTVSATVPHTGRNRRILRYPSRLDTAADPNSPRRRALVADGAFRRSGALNITGSTAEGMSFNIGFDNSTAYLAWMGRKLADLGGLPVISTTPEALMNEMAAYYYDGQPWYEFAVFPVALSRTVMDEESVSAKTYWEMLNVPGKDYTMEQPGKVTRIIDNTPTEVSVPAGYGLSPFLYAYRVLELIFADLGVEIAENPFATRTDLMRLVVLNNTADAICSGTLRYSELMPDCTVEEFLNALWVRFGLTFRIDSETGKACLRLLDDIIKDEAALTLDPYLSSPHLGITYNAPRYITLTAGTSIEGAAPACDRWEDFVSGISLADIQVGYDILARQKDGPAKGWLGRETVTGKWWKLDRLNGKEKESSSGFFSWDPHSEECEPMDLSSADECVPVEKVSIGTTGTANPFTGYAPAYLVGARHFHSYIKGNDNEEGEGESTPLAFMWAYNTGHETIGRLTPEAPDGKEQYIDDGGEPGTTLYLQYADGLFARYWKRYDELLRHGSRKIEIKARLSKKLLSSIDILRPVMLHGCRCLIEKMEYRLPSGPDVDVSATLQSISTIGEYNIDKEQGIPAVAMTATGLRWVLYEWNWQDAEDAKRPQLDQEAWLKFREQLAGLEVQGDGEDILVDPLGIAAISDWVEELPEVLPGEIPSVPAGSKKLVTFHGRINYSCSLVRRVYYPDTGETISKTVTGEPVGYTSVDYTSDAVYICAYIAKQ